MLKQLKEYLFARNVREKTTYQVAEEEYESWLQENPEYLRETNLTSAEHAYKTGLSKQIIAAAYGEEIAEEAIKNCNIKLFKKESV